MSAQALRFKRLESSIERAFVKAVNARGWLTIKLSARSQSHWPDRLVLLPNNEHLFIEFKREGGKVTPAQNAIHDDIRKLGHHVCVCYSKDEAIAACERLTKFA